MDNLRLSASPRDMTRGTQRALQGITRSFKNRRATADSRFIYTTQKFQVVGIFESLHDEHVSRTTSHTSILYSPHRTSMSIHSIIYRETPSSTLIPFEPQQSPPGSSAPSCRALSSPMRLGDHKPPWRPTAPLLQA